MMSSNPPKLLSSTLFIFIFLLLLGTASSLPSTNTADTGHGIPGWVSDAVPDRGNDTSHHSEISCYALQYGLIGSISHVLTWYTIGALIMGRSPLRPWRELKSPRVDMLLAGTGLLAASLITVFTMVRCWQFVLVAAWKVCLSISLSALSMHVAVLFAREKQGGGGASIPQEELSAARWWLLMYILGMLVGLFGLLSLVREAWPDNRAVQRTTFICGRAAVLVGGLWAASRWCPKLRDMPRDPRNLIFQLALGLVAAVYSDWALAALADNPTGQPSGDVAWFYFLYFAVKRLPTLSF
ncbi:hypothetical protein BZA05DRAFT_410697 [Tricharina praecox]|uniref:uncharacterized protein n=1 Tax=Tricharina praecox TaxID=43433 RepID=UPI002220D25E|nr:uncharacterized protein BZA05DRAFT_410697 [Tricharina praecox]KAI5843590.1 hypothetical protein BZA05DRAFT_410697 [Tricharina praecox]